MDDFQPNCTNWFKLINLLITFKRLIDTNYKFRTIAVKTNLEDEVNS